MRQNTVKESGTLQDRLPFLYVEHAIIKQKDSSISIFHGDEETPIPIASLAVLILGPGTDLTHRAVEALADSGCLVVWAGDGMKVWYASGRAKDRASENMLIQARYWADEGKHMDVVRWMYQKRFGNAMSVKGKSLEVLRGEEGQRMKDIYQRYAAQYGVEWKGRRYDVKDFDSQEPIQKLITEGNQLLYNICHATILSLGFSPALGFIHTGKMLSFVYDIADLYKTDIVIPVAFEMCKDFGGKDSSDFRHQIRRRMQDYGIFKVVTKDLYEMFHIKGKDKGEDVDSGLKIWDGRGERQAGYNFANQSL